MTTFLLDALLNEVYRNTGYTPAATVYCGLLKTITNREAGTVVEATYTSYARAAITFGAPTAAAGGRQVANSALVTFPQNTGSTEDEIGFGIYDASTSGNLLDVGLLAPGAPCFATVTVADTVTAPSHGFANTQKVRIDRVPGTTLPTGLSEDTEYFVITSATDTFQLSLTSGGAAIDITTAGAMLVLPYTPVTVAPLAIPEFAIGTILVQKN